MAKVAATSDMVNMPVLGKWIWKEDSQSLEYMSNNPNADKHDKKKDRRQQKGGHHHDNRGRTSPTQMGRGGPFGVGARGGKAGGRGGIENRARSGKRTHSNVTLEDIKIVSRDMLSGVENISDTFTGLFDADQFDQFLLCLLNYFHWYFEKKAHEEKPNPMNIEPSLREKKHYADLCTRIETAQKILGQSYCILVLGIGMEPQHHMKGGVSRVSNTYQDRSMYETLYSFCTFLVWVAFKRKDYETVKKELNRILRSQTFNPAIRIKNAPEAKPAAERKVEDGEEEEKKEKTNEKKLTPAEYRRQQGRRPPIKSIINQRSPALVSILPSPKEEAHWLFRRAGALSPNSSDSNCDSASILTPCIEDALSEINRQDISMEDPSKYDHIAVDTSKLHVGIIGEPLNQFHPITLTPKGTDPEGEEEEEDGEQKPKDARRGSNGALKTPGSQERRMSREGTSVSQVTQEGLPDD